MTYLSFSAGDIDTLAAQLNEFVDNGGTIESVSIAVDKGFAYAIVLGQEADEDDDAAQ